METYRAEESSVLGFEAGSAFISTSPVTDLPRMHGETDETRYDEDCTHIQREGGENGNETKGDSKRDKSEQFVFSDPRSRWFELSQFADSIIGRRIEKIDGLSNLSEIYTLRPKFADEVATRLLREESERNQPYTKSEARSRVHTFINLRVRTWLGHLKRQEVALGIDSAETIVERDENGDIVDCVETNHEWNISEDRKNPFHRDPLDVIIAKEEALVLEVALYVLASRHTRQAKKHLAIIARILDRPELTDCAILNSLTSYEKNILTFHAIRTLSMIMEKLYRVKRLEKQKKRRIRRTPFRTLRENYRRNTPLFNENEKNGEVIIVFSRDNNCVPLKESAEYPEYDDAA